MALIKSYWRVEVKTGEEQGHVYVPTDSKMGAWKTISSYKKNKLRIVSGDSNEIKAVVQRGEDKRDSFFQDCFIIPVLEEKTRREYSILCFDGSYEKALERIDQNHKIVFGDIDFDQKPVKAAVILSLDAREKQKQGRRNALKSDKVLKRVGRPPKNRPVEEPTEEVIAEEA